MKRILSTKKFTLAQRELLLNSGIGFVEYDAISITYLDFEAPNTIENAIFTSQNGARSVMGSRFQIQDCYCVGEKTKQLLSKNGLKVVEIAKNSKELGEVITKKHQNKSFYYFCGSHRREELPDILKNQKIEFFEIKTYKTELKPKHFDQKWDGILFFSPSGVASFTTENTLKDTWAICIGETTAIEAKKHTDKVVISNSTSVESVIAKTVKILK